MNWLSQTYLNKRKVRNILQKSHSHFLSVQQNHFNVLYHKSFFSTKVFKFTTSYKLLWKISLLYGIFMRRI